ncbi:MAG: hypothetical protein KC657_02115 [Myxococcales bacterium]|nr:hypothetical protein [Myxococcales bacterium]
MSLRSTLALAAFALPLVAAAPLACSSSEDAPATDGDAGADAKRKPAPAPEPEEYDATPVDDGWGRVDAGPTSPLTTIDLGVVSTGTEKTFDLPKGALGFNVVAIGRGRDLGIKDIKSPSGELVHKDFTPFNGSHPTTNSLFGGVASAGVPASNHPKAMPDLEPGKWSVTFTGDNAKAKVRVQTTPDGQFHGGVLDVRLFIPDGVKVGGTVVTAATARTEYNVRSRVDAFFDAFERLFGIGRGNVEIFALPTVYKQAGDAVIEAFTQTAPAGDAQALNIILTQPTRDQSWWGIAGGIPGAATVSGTAQSAVALATMSYAGARAEGMVLAHEAGHFLGLNHTTEFGSEAFDPLEDTPQCERMDELNFRSCPDYKNLMHAASSGALEASPLQVRVVRGSPVYHAFLSGAPKQITAPAPAFDAGKELGGIFGHPGVAPDAVESAVLATLCGAPGHGPVTLARVPRAELEALARRPGVESIVRNAATKALTRLR